MYRSMAPRTDLPDALRAELRYSASARLALLIAFVRDGLIGLGLAFGGGYGPAAFLAPGPGAGLHQIPGPR